MSTISSIHARQILDSRGNPTVEAEVILDNGMTAPVPAFQAAPAPVPKRLWN